MKLYLGYFTLLIAALFSLSGFASDESAVPELSSAAQESLQTNRNFQDLTPGQRAKIAQLRPVQKRVLANRIQNMTAEEREAARDRFENMTTEERQAARDDMKDRVEQHRESQDEETL
jgi:hypothetical protein